MNDSESQNESNFNELFARARQLNTEEQQWFIERECADDAQRSQLLELLASFREVPQETFVNPMLPVDAVVQAYEAASDRSTSPDDDVFIRCGAEIGPYKLLERLGEGGMGTVYMAEQTEPVTRRVALKVIKPGVLSKGLLARFEVERQALSMMDHPHIAKVLDAGSTENGQPYYAMELIKGIPITEYCDRNRLDTKSRLALFVSVCQAVGHAHQKGVIHRDIKPSNVLVAEYDDKAVPKVIDFGVAKATAQKLTDKTVFTRFGQLVGTLEYMSPEQAKLNQLDVDTRSDVYSLGVLLYELLTGDTPLDRKRLRSAALDEMIRIICEEDPPKPSTRLTTAEAADTIAANRSVEVRSLTRMIRGELDWIVMRSIDKERKRRYQSAGDFADDIRRYLSGEAVEACPPTLPYRARKIISRNKTAAIVMMSMLLSLTAASLLGWSLFSITKKSYDRATEEVYQEKAMRLVAESNALLDDQPVLSTERAIEAVETTHRRDGTVSPAARMALWLGVSRLGGTHFARQNGDVRSISASPDGRWLVSAGGGNGPVLHDLHASKSVVLPHANPWYATISPANSWVAAASPNGVAVWKLDDGNTRRKKITMWERNPQTDYQPKSLLFSGDGRWLVSAYYVGDVQVWDMEAGDPEQTGKLLTGHEDSNIFGGSISISADGSVLATSSIDGAIKLWDLRSDELSPTWEFQHAPFKALAVSPDGRWLAAGGEQPKLWDLHSDDPNESATTLKNHGGVKYVTVDDDSRLLATVGNDGSCCLYDLTADNPRRECLMLVSREGGFDRIEMSEGKQLLAGGWNGTIRLWNLHQVDRDSLPTIHGEDGIHTRLWSADVTPHGTELLVGHDSRIRALEMSADGKHVFSGGQRGNIRRWKLASANPAGGHQARQDGVVQAVGVTPDGKWLVVGCEGPNSRLWTLNGTGSLSEAIDLRGADDGLGKFVISSDSRWLIGTSSVRASTDEVGYARHEKVAHAWDLKSDDPGKPAFQLEGHNAAVTSIAISETGNRVVTGSLDSTVRVWNISNDGVELIEGSPLELRRPSPESVQDDKEEEIVRSVATNKDGSIVVAAGHRHVFVWDFNQNPTSAITLPGEHDGILDVEVSPDGRWVASGGSYGGSYVWDLDAAPDYAPRPIPGHRWSGTFVARIRFSTDGRWMMTGSWDKITNVFDLGRKDPFAEPAKVIENPSGVHSLAVSLDNRRILSGSTTGPTVLEFSGEATSFRLPASDVKSVALTPDGRRAITGSGDTVSIWELELEDLLATAKQLVGSD